MAKKTGLLNFLKEKKISSENVAKVIKYSELFSENQWPDELLFDALELVYSIAFDYNLNDNELMKTLKSCRSFEELKARLRSVVLKRFCNEEIKSVDMLTKEIEEFNVKPTSESMRKEHGEIVEAFHRWSAVGDFNRMKIAEWANDVKRKHLNPQKSERIAVVWRAMELASEHKLRDVQKLSLSLLYHENGAGKIAQINTGEGKTIIIAMLAVLFCLDGHRVDIGELSELHWIIFDVCVLVTTSPELSIPQSKDMKNFFDLFKLASANVDEGDKKAAYKCDVLYGSINEFEGDVLQDEYLKEDIRSNRLYDIVIIDEADSMLIDGINNIIRLSSPMPGMSDLIPCLVAVAMELESVETDMKTDESGEIFYHGKDCKTIKKPLNDSQPEFVEAMVNDKLIKRIKNHDNSQAIKDEIKIPKHLLKFVLENRLMAWIKSAYLAKHDYVLGRDYVIRDDDIKIVDLYNTGIVYRNMKWADGLHQFLQIKHDIYVTSEDLVTNYLGNPTFFYKYKRIYGLTGTLGDESTKDFLLQAYGVEPIIISPFKVKQHCELTPIVVQSKPKWYEAVIDSCITKLKMGRAVTIIAESINETVKFRDILTSSPINYPLEKILMYQTEKDSKITNKIIEPGEIIITTNICGRGVNIVLSDDVNNNGGLHICLTFLPDNDRVQMQNIGRTSRAGKPGTSQVVLVDEASTDLTTIVGCRNVNNVIKFQGYLEEMKKIKIKSDVFTRFCRLLHIIDGSCAIPIEWNISQFRTDGFQNDLLCDTVKERFSIWLKIHENACENLEEQYNKFEHSIRTQLVSGVRISDNPFYYILSGNQYLQVGKYEDVLKQFAKAIEIDPDCGAFAHVNRSVAYLELNKVDDVLSDLRAARKLMGQMIVENESYSNAVKNFAKPYLVQKFNRRAEIFRINQKSIDSLINGTRPNSDKPESSKPKCKNSSVRSDVAESDINTDGILLRPSGKGKRCRIVFLNVMTQLNDNADEELYIKDATEIAQNGFIGPVEIKEWNPSLFERGWKNLNCFFSSKKSKR